MKTHRKQPPLPALPVPRPAPLILLEASPAPLLRGLSRLRCAMRQAAAGGRGGGSATGRGKFLHVLLLGLAMTFVRGIAPAQAASTPVTDCGQELSVAGAYHLTNHLGPCQADGVIITANKVRLDLAGFSLLGSGCLSAGTGIRVSGVAQVTIQGGTVRHFGAGVELSSTTDSVLQALAVTENCQFGVGLAAGSQGNIIKNNDISANGDGIVLLGVSSNSNSNNIFRDNTLDHNDGFGLLLKGGNADNTIVGNTALGNATGIGVFSTGNLLKNNTALGNATDLQARSSSCHTNTWTHNTFVTDMVDLTPDGGPGVGCIQ